MLSFCVSYRLHLPFHSSFDREFRIVPRSEFSFPDMMTSETISDLASTFSSLSFWILIQSSSNDCSKHISEILWMHASVGQEEFDNSLRFVEGCKRLP